MTTVAPISVTIAVRGAVPPDQLVLRPHTRPCRATSRRNSHARRTRPGAYPCEMVDPEVFFTEYDPDLVAAAKSVCRECPSRSKCLVAALHRGEDYGVWGGLSAEERRDLHGRPVQGPHAVTSNEPTGSS